MKKIFLLGFLIVFGLQVISAQQSNPRATVTVVNLADTVMTHVYGNRWYSTTFEKHLFNYYQETTRGLTDILGAANMNVTTTPAPAFINRMSLLNLVGKPSKEMERWFDTLHSKQGVDFVVFILRKFEPENKISHRYLNGKQYGIGTYSRYPDAISMFSFIGYYIFDTRNYQEVHINHNHDQYILTDLRLNHRMSFRELKDLPQKYLDLTVDKLRIVVNTRNVEIKRTLLEYLNN